MVAAHGSRHYRNEKMRDKKEQPMVAISTGAGVVITAGGAIITQSCYHSRKTVLRMIWDDHWDDVGMRHWDDDREGDDWGDHWDKMMMMSRMITVIGMMVMMILMKVMMMVIVVAMVMVMG